MVGLVTTMWLRAASEALICSTLSQCRNRAAGLRAADARGAGLATAASFVAAPQPAGDDADRRARSGCGDARALSGALSAASGSDARTLINHAAAFDGWCNNSGRAVAAASLRRRRVRSLGVGAPFRMLSQAGGDGGDDGPSDSDSDSDSDPGEWEAFDDFDDDDDDFDAEGEDDDEASLNAWFDEDDDGMEDEEEMLLNELRRLQEKGLDPTPEMMQDILAQVEQLGEGEGAGLAAAGGAEQEDAAVDGDEDADHGSELEDRLKRVLHDDAYASVGPKVGQAASGGEPIKGKSYGFKVRRPLSGGMHRPHVMMDGTAMPKPAEYARPAHVTDEYLARIRHAIFGTHIATDNQRTGRKQLNKTLHGDRLLNYYLPKPKYKRTTERDEVLMDDEEEYRLEKLASLHAQGKRKKPKKGEGKRSKKRGG